jgi:hypothetical protein
MVTTTQISDKLKEVEKELSYINTTIAEGNYNIEDQYVYPDKTSSKVEGNTFQRQVTVLVAEKHLLCWVLGKDL